MFSFLLLTYSHSLGNVKEEFLKETQSYSVGNFWRRSQGSRGSWIYWLSFGDAECAEMGLAQLLHVEWHYRAELREGGELEVRAENV